MEAACTQVIMSLWEKYRMADLSRHSNVWDEIHEDIYNLLGFFPDFKDIILDFLGELESRCREREFRDGSKEKECRSSNTHL